MRVVHNGIDLSAAAAVRPRSARGARGARASTPRGAWSRRSAASSRRRTTRRSSRRRRGWRRRRATSTSSSSATGALRDRARGAGGAPRPRRAACASSGCATTCPALLAAVDVLALTSRYEGLPNVVIEAMATGAVAVATDVGGCRELIVHGRERAHRAARPAGGGGARGARRPRAGRPAARLRQRGARDRIEGGFTVDAMVRADRGRLRGLAAGERRWRAPPDRMRIAYVIPAWPPVASQPFVVNEMIAVQEAGHERRRAAALCGARRSGSSRDVRTLPAGRRAAAGVGRSGVARSRAGDAAAPPVACGAHAGRSPPWRGDERLGTSAARGGDAEGPGGRGETAAPRRRAPARALRQPDGRLRGDRRRRRRAAVLVHGARLRHLLAGAPPAERHARLEAALMPRGRSPSATMRAISCEPVCRNPSGGGCRPCTSGSRRRSSAPSRRPTPATASSA